jgi:hypothetical protein
VERSDTHHVMDRANGCKVDGFHLPLAQNEETIVGVVFAFRFCARALCCDIRDHPMLGHLRIWLPKPISRWLGSDGARRW